MGEARHHHEHEEWPRTYRPWVHVQIHTSCQELRQKYWKAAFMPYMERFGITRIKGANFGEHSTVSETWQNGW